MTVDFLRDVKQDHSVASRMTYICIFSYLCVYIFLNKISRISSGRMAAEINTKSRNEQRYS
jgi:hypothetical protein